MTTRSMAAIAFGKPEDPSQAKPIRRLHLARANLSQTALHRELNELIEATASSSEDYRGYLGASAIGSECLRKVQYDWLCDPPEYPVRTKDIFDSISKRACVSI